MVWGWRKGQEVKSHTLSVPIRFEKLLGSYRVLLQLGRPVLLITMHKCDDRQRQPKDNVGLKRVF